MFSTSKEQSFVFSSVTIFLRLWIRLLEFWMLQVLGSCSILLSCAVTYFANLSGAAFQLTIGRIGFCCLCSFMVPYMWCSKVMLMYFHLLFLFIVLLLLMLFFTFCCLFVLSCGNYVKWFCVMNSILLLRSLYNMTRVLPLSALVPINLFWFNFFFILFIRFRSWDSSFNWAVCRLSSNAFCLFTSFWILLAINCLVYFRSLSCS
jgi:hypothetical protein